MKQYLIPVVITLLILTSFSGCLNENKTEKTIITTIASDEDALQNLHYINMTYGYGFDPPENWSIELPNGYTQAPDWASFHPFDYNTTLTISPWNVDTENTISASVDHIVQLTIEINNNNNYTLISKSEKIINGITAVEIVFYFEQSHNNKTEKHVWMIKDGKGFYIVYNSFTESETYEEYLSVVDSSILTFYIFKDNDTFMHLKNADVRLKSTEFIGGKYNATILYEERFFYEFWTELTEIKYTKNGREVFGDYYPWLKDVFNWIKANTSKNCTILCWWDYGCMIEGYTERNIIASFASLALKNTVINFMNNTDDEYINEQVKRAGGWNSNETLVNIAKVLTSSNISSDETKDILQQYNVSYIFTNRYDSYLARVFFNTSGKNSEEYVYLEPRFGDYYLPTEKGNETLIFQMWKDTVDIPGLELVYELPYHDPLNNIDYPDLRLFKVDNS